MQTWSGLVWSEFVSLHVIKEKPEPSEKTINYLRIKNYIVYLV